MQDILHRLTEPFQGGVRVSSEGSVTVPTPQALEGEAMDRLVRAAVFADEATRDVARWLLWEVGQAVGVRAGSIHDLYIARGRGEVGGFTVPAINIRGLVYDSARALFRAAKRLNAAAFLCEIARSLGFGRLVLDVEHGAFGTAGLDRIVAFAAQPIANLDQLHRALRSHAPGEAAPARILREGELLTLAITPAEAPSPSG